MSTTSRHWMASSSGTADPWERYFFIWTTRSVCSCLLSTTRITPPMDRRAKPYFSANICATVELKQIEKNAEREERRVMSVWKSVRGTILCWRFCSCLGFYRWSFQIWEVRQLLFWQEWEVWALAVWGTSRDSAWMCCGSLWTQRSKYTDGRSGDMRYWEATAEAGMTLCLCSAVEEGGVWTKHYVKKYVM